MTDYKFFRFLIHFFLLSSGPSDKQSGKELYPSGESAQENDEGG